MGPLQKPQASHNPLLDLGAKPQAWKLLLPGLGLDAEG